MNLVDKYSDDQSMYVSPQAVNETWINKKLTLSSDQYRPEIYDLYVDKMIHQYHGLQHPYQEGHPAYSKCSVCPHINDIAVRHYTKVGDASTQFTITVTFLENTQLKIHVEEKKPDKQTIQLHFQVDISMTQQDSYIKMKQPVQTQDFLLSWMNSLLMELQHKSKMYQDNKEFELIKKEVETTMYDAMYFLRSSLY